MEQLFSISGQTSQCVTNMKYYNLSCCKVFYTTQIDDSFRFCICFCSCCLLVYCCWCLPPIV